MRRVRPPNGGVLIPKNLLWQKGRLYEVEGGLSNRHTVQAVNSKG